MDGRHHPVFTPEMAAEWVQMGSQSMATGRVSDKRNNLRDPSHYPSIMTVSTQSSLHRPRSEVVETMTVPTALAQWKIQRRSDFPCQPPLSRRLLKPSILRELEDSWGEVVCCGVNRGDGDAGTGGEDRYRPWTSAAPPHHARRDDPPVLAHHHQESAEFPATCFVPKEDSRRGRTRRTFKSRLKVDRDSKCTTPSRRTDQDCTPKARRSQDPGYDSSSPPPRRNFISHPSRRGGDPTGAYGSTGDENLVLLGSRKREVSGSSTHHGSLPLKRKGNQDNKNEEVEPPREMPPPPLSRDPETCQWRTAVDPKSGRTYYYHLETRETQWRKPMELATPEERKIMEEKERQQREFFAAMEANIIKSISTGVYASPTSVAEVVAVESPTTPTERREMTLQGQQPDDTPNVPAQGSNAMGKTKVPDLAKPNLVRTISAMDESVLAGIVRRVPSHRHIFHHSGTDPREITFSPASEWPLRTSQTMPSSSRRSTLSREEHSLDSIQETNNMMTLSTMSSTAKLNMAGLSLDDPQGEVKPTLSWDQRSMSLSSAFGRGKSEQSLDLNMDAPSAHRTSSRYFESLDDDELLGFASDEESEALHKLAAITDEMAMFDDTDLGDDNDSELSGLAVVAEMDETEHSAGSLETPSAAHTVAMTPTPQRTTPPSAAATSLSVPRMEKPAMARRNTCGTLYVGSTLSAPDKDATIKCVCGVFRAHILQSEMEIEPAKEEYRVFNDLESQQKAGKKQYQPCVDYVVRPPPPTLDEITTFYRDVFRRAQMEADCIIMSLIYVERLIKKTNGELRPRSNNWRSILFSCMVLSSKVWDDLSMWNADFSQTCPTGVRFSLQRINELEVAILAVLQYHVKVLASEYAKYYFLLRSLLIKSGLGGDDLKSMSPLDVEGAKRLQHVSSTFQSRAARTGLPRLAGFRSKSIGTVVQPKVMDSQLMTEARGKVGLEHVVQM